MKLELYTQNLKWENNLIGENKAVGFKKVKLGEGVVEKSIVIFKNSEKTIVIGTLKLEIRLTETFEDENI